MLELKQCIAFEWGPDFKDNAPAEQLFNMLVGLLTMAGVKHGYAYQDARFGRTGFAAIGNQEAVDVACAENRAKRRAADDPSDPFKSR